MTSAVHECPCWLAPGPDGKTYPVAWLGMHRVVEVETSDGSVFRGMPGDVFPFPGPDGRYCLMWEVGEGLGEDCGVLIEDVVEVRPIDPGPTPADALAQLASALDGRLSAPVSVGPLNIIVGDHEYLEVRITRLRVPCQAGYACA